ncbi:expressed unknown protein [Seminavis robusta]|uniref:Uncharacterized protein n=1 Tax=Seminavis robusta TaxID=568900 RepID=A0A9N8HTB8_9STRA|nr:expressed unknown protein [Seminavis robusta]|eukprot:Sro1493_g277290.1 n/a (278) ;mRNA; f:11595-12428
MFGGPLSSLYYKGLFPCCQKEEDKNAREALQQINQVGERIIWHRQPRKISVENVKKAAFSFFGKKKEAQEEEDNNNPLIKAKFQLVDNSDGIPEIRVGKRGVNKSTQDDDDDDDWEFGGFEDEEAPAKKKKPKRNDNNLQIDISLKRIHTVVPVDQDLIQLNILEDNGQKTKEWIKFSVDGQQEQQGARNMFVHNLQVLMEWDKVRRNNCGELEYNETSAASSLRARAQKAAHFARREIEMKQTKKSREERKAKYVQESGGLKYTALAMARNASASS